MNRRVKKPLKPRKSPQARYIKIRIKYYPIGKEIIIPFLVLVFCFLGYQLFPIGKGVWFVLQQSYVMSQRTNLVLDRLPKFYTSSVLNGVFVAKKPFDRLRVEDQPPKNNHVINNGPRDKKQVALTFDADMTPEMREAIVSGETKSSYNKNIVDILNKTQTKATIFISGMWIELYPDVMRELAANPLFEFGNHSYSHPGFDGACWGLRPIGDDQNQDEIGKTQTLLKEYTKKDNKLFRFPGGCYSKKDLEDVWKNKLYVVHWDSVGNDGFNDDVERIENNVLTSTKNGSVIVLHFNGPPNSPMTDDALPKIISSLKERGYEFVKVSELLGLDYKPHKLQLSDFLSNIGYNERI